MSESERHPVLAGADVAPISYAQNFEDVRLWRALGELRSHIWVDVGAAHPTDLSVTRLFHERGWHGINVEPGPEIALLRRDRTGDVNLEAVVTDHVGEIDFNIASPYPGLSSIGVRNLEADPIHVRSWETVRRPATTLASLLHEHGADLPIAFLKVDVEGAERSVLASNDWSRFRPLVVVVEAIEPGTHRPSYAEWEPILFDADYTFAVDDGINRFYVRADHSDHDELVARIAAPVSPVDGFVPIDVIAGSVARSESSRIAEERAQLTASVLRLDREAKLLATELAGRGNADAGTAREAALAQRVRDLETGWDRRLGGWAISLMGPLWRFVRPLAEAGIRLGRMRRARPSNVRAVHGDWTRVGRHLASVGSVAAEAAIVPAADAGIDPSLVTAVDASGDAGVDRPDERCRATLLSRRGDHPALLTAAEWSLVEDAAAAMEELGGTDRTPTLARLASFRAVEARPPVAGARCALVIDTAAAQLELQCGTRTHARNLLRVVLDAVPSGVQVLSITASGLPPLDADLAARFDGEWDGGDEGRVGAFLQLAPFIHDDSDEQIRLVSSPAIRSATVWLDAIMGVHPRFFLRTAEDFIDYQFGLECLARSDRVLSLSDASSAELVATGVPAERIVRTGAAPGLERGSVATSAVPRLPFDRWIVVVGNALPHKNVATGVAGAVAAALRATDDLGVVVVANMTLEQNFELTGMANALGLERHRLVHLGMVDDAVFDGVIRGADLVVVPSLHEGYSLPVVEALDRGTPVAVSDIPAHRELLGAGPWLFDPADPADARRAIERVRRRPDAILDRERSGVASNLVPGGFDGVVRETTRWLCADLGPWAPDATADGAIDPAIDAATAGATDMSTVDRTRVASGSPVLAGRHLSLSKVCELEDFATPRLREVLREVFAHELVRFGPDFPDGAEWRKYWEVAMAVRTFRDTGLLDGSSRFLGIGAGNEPTLFHLTRHAAHVLATDLYLADGWEESAHSSMLTDPGRHWPFPWEPERLEVRHMDALDLHLPDASFDGVFSSSSIEHFGDRDAVVRSLDEIHRVLRSGGILSLSTEFRISGDPPGIPGALLFDADDVRDLFVDRGGWTFVEPFDPSVSPATMATAASFVEVAADQEAQVARLGGLWTHNVRYGRYPHIVLEHDGRSFTSFHLALRKDE